MVELRQHWDIKWQDGNWISFPAAFVETFENKQYLRLKATHQGLVNLLSKDKSRRNASLAASQVYSKLMQQRNDVAAGVGKQELHQASAAAMPKPCEGDVHADLFHGDHTSDEETAEPMVKKRRYVPTGDYTVLVDVDGTMVEMLMKGKKPSRSDLLVLLNGNMLDAVFNALAADVSTALHMETRPYKKRSG